jgi:hypothetical protein
VVWFGEKLSQFRGCGVDSLESVFEPIAADGVDSKASPYGMPVCEILFNESGMGLDIHRKRIGF